MGHVTVVVETNREVDGEVDSVALAVSSGDLTVTVGRTIGADLTATATLPASGGTFDIHDDVTTTATIVDADLVVFSDEGTAGDPMRVTSAAGLADYMQVEVELNASRITAGTLPLSRGGTGGTTASAARTSLGLGTAATRDTGTTSGDVALLGTGGAFSTARIPSLDASKITAGTLSTARLGSGTASSTTYLRGDQTWATVAAGLPLTGGTLTGALAITPGNVADVVLTLTKGGTGNNPVLRMVHPDNQTASRPAPLQRPPRRGVRLLRGERSAGREQCTAGYRHWPWRKLRARCNAVPWLGGRVAHA